MPIFVMMRDDGQLWHTMGAPTDLNCLLTEPTCGVLGIPAISYWARPAALPDGWACLHARV